MIMDKQTIFEWIVKVIDTCNNDFHFAGVDKLIELFNDRFGDPHLSTELNILKKQKWNEIHTILY